MGWRRFQRRGWWDDERARELEAHLQIEADENVARGMSADEARAAARRKLGSPAHIREEIYQMNTVAWLDTFVRDLRYAVRLLRRSPGFALVAVLSLALGVGANTAIFQLIDAVRLRRLPVDHPEQLVEVKIVDATSRTGSFRGRRPSLTNPLWEGILGKQQAFSGMAAWGATTFDLSTGGEAREAHGLWVSGSFFPTLGVAPFVGRLFTRADDVRGCGAVGVVISHAFWQREFGASLSAIGRTLSLDGQPLAILGVTPPQFFGVDVGRSFDVAVPICSEPLMRPRSALDQPDTWWLAAVGRLKPGWTPQRAGSHLEAISAGLFQATLPPRYSPEDARRYRQLHLGALPASTGVSNLRQVYAAPLWVLFATTGLVLLIACTNLANLLLARATVRERELAVRLAIGASRSRIVRQLLTESALIAAAGGAAGVFLARWLSQLLVAFLTTGANRLFLDLTIDWRVLAFTIALAVTTVMIFGLAPALRATGTRPAEAMRGVRASTDTRGRLGLRRSLIVAQIAFSLVLVVGALLFARTWRNLATLDAGFDPAGVLSVQLDLTRAGIPDGSRRALYEEICNRVAALPGVERAAQAWMIPISGGGWNERVIVNGVAQPGAANFNRVSPGYFKVMRTRLIAGRDFDGRDAAGAAPAAVVTEMFVKKYLGGGPFLDRTFQVETAPGEARPLYRVVGVVQDSKYFDLRDAFDPLVYLASAQDRELPPYLTLAVRVSGDLRLATKAITATIGSVSPSIVVDFKTMDTLVKESLVAERLMATLSASFGGLAALIAAIGLYGVMSYMVARRRAEIGIRIALGAGRPQVVRMVLQEAGALLLAGLAIGTVLAVLAGRAAVTLLFDLKPWDPLTLAAATAGLSLVAAAASWLPARHAASVQPTVALRSE